MPLAEVEGRQGTFAMLRMRRACRKKSGASRYVRRQVSASSNIGDQGVSLLPNVATNDGEPQIGRSAFSN